MDLELNPAHIRLLVENFYDDVRADERLSIIFNAKIGDHWDAHIDRLVDFWCTVMLATNQYRGNVFGTHMAIGGGIDRDHFVRWLALFDKNTSALFDEAICEEFMKVARRIGASLQYGLLGEMPQH